MLPCSTSSFPATEVRQHMLEGLELRKKTSPNETFAKLPATPSTYADGFRAITNLEVWNAVNRVAWWLDENLGRSQNFETLAYLGPGDLRYSIILLAAMKTGYKVFFPSLRNSKAAFEDLFQRLDCKTVITTSPEPAPVSLLSTCGVRKKLHIRSLSELLNDQDVTDYPYEKTYEQAKHDPICVLHTSGSTGIPKPLIFTNEFVAAVASNTSLQPPEGFDSPNRFLIRGSSLVTLPAFHMAGLAFTLFVPVFNESIPVYPLPGPPPSLHSLVEAVSNSDIDWVLVTPITIQAMSQDREALTTIASKIGKLLYIGGAVPKEAGDAVASSMPLYQIFGSSEFGSFPLVYREPLSQKSDWRSVEFHPQINAKLRHRFDGLYELVLVNEHVYERPQPVFALFPNLQEYETGDLFTPHPQTPSSWTYESRADDVIVFITGEKTNPVDFEQAVGVHPEVRDVLMIGDGKFESSLLVELKDNKDLSAEEKRRVTERIWPTVRKANAYYPGYAHIALSRIVLTNPATPMARTGKGTVQRKATIALYKEILDRIYNDTSADTSFTFPENFVSTNLQSVVEALQQLLRHLTGWDQIRDEDEFFSLGMDSLIAHRLSQRLKQQPELAWIETKMVYMHPSIRLLAEAIVASRSQLDESAARLKISRVTQMSEMLEMQKVALESLCQDLQTQPTSPKPPQPVRQVVLLTGSTGNVGSFLLDELLLNEKVGHVYCLNRSIDSRAVQVKKNADRGLAVEFPSSRVTFLTGRIGEPDFGQPASCMAQIKSTVTHIIHNAWPVDFNRSLISFKPSLDGLVNLISLAAHSVNRPSLLFLSSISATANYCTTPDAQATVPEAVLHDIESPAGTGYGESKYLGELLLDHASKRLCLQSGIIRIGQVTGSVRSLRGWSRTEWFPRLVISSKHIGALPETLGFKDEQHPAGTMGDMDWIPIDYLSNFILECGSILSRNGAGASPLVFHAVNPSSMKWTDFLPQIRSCLSDRANCPSGSKTEEIQVLPYSEWVDLLAAKFSAESQESRLGVREMEYKNPGFKLLDFFSQISHPDSLMSRLSTARTASSSLLLQTWEPLRVEWMVGWIQDWFSARK
ncbi:hypothetical protein QQS21_006568 [Conoideocrella luteorostrata]|uniref:Carrier domain-containing protein n=1 Tax=Conoideocrella luteorostrata TaxID=1105319 RepID=A0AAJ0CMD1_9HYPO|nr:hypothetical protein QQS21_006568 [Conoideocrella luteorostrata]